MNYFIVTGGSRGFGNAIVETLSADPQNRVAVIARTNSEMEAPNVRFFRFDLSAPEKIGELIDEIFLEFTNLDANLFLVNNAALATPIGRIGDLNHDDLIRTLQINAVAPFVLCSAFLKAANAYHGRVVVVNISSGAGNKPFVGWSPYCVSKAAINMLSRCIAHESKKVEILNHDPGVLDTDMQEVLRSQPESEFPPVTQFSDYYRDSKLVSPSIAAQKLLSDLLK